jgi:adenylate cyclase
MIFGRLGRLGRRTAVALACAFLGGTLAATGEMRILERQGIDLLLPIAAQLGFAARPLPERPPVALVAVREETFRNPYFAERPMTAWTPHFAGILAGVGEGGARAIGLDLIFATTLAKPELIPGFDDPLNAVLDQLARADLVVAGYTQLSESTIEPMQAVLLGGEANLRPVNIPPDPDGVVRLYPGSLYPGDLSGLDHEVPSFAAELVRRAGGRFDDATVPLIDPTIAPADIPLYDFGDLWRCALAGDLDFFRRAFAGRVVIVGVVLDVEDRFLTARRLMDEPADHEPEARCAPGEPATRVGRATMPGSMIHASAVLTQLLDRAPAVMPGWATGLAVAAVAGLAAVASFALAPLAGGLLLLLAMAGAVVAGAAALMAGTVLPVPQALVAVAGTFTAVYAFRFVVEDRARRRITTAFRHYLAPALVDRLAENPDALRLGGEVREVTVMFVDLAGFTSLSEVLADRPQELVAVTNRHLAAAAEAMGRHRGYVDKFIGDAVMGVWGAPLPDPDGPRHAVDAALAVRAALAALGSDGLSARIGINSGPAILGNVGMPTRLNYTVLGDAVNVAARLETANKIYGTRILVGEATRRALPPGIPTRRIDRVAVQGRRRPIRIYELVDDRSEPEAERRLFHHAVTLYYRRRFAEAEGVFAGLLGRDPAAAVWRERAAAMAASPPPARWDRVHTLAGK